MTLILQLPPCSPSPSRWRCAVIAGLAHSADHTEGGQQAHVSTSRDVPCVLLSPSPTHPLGRPHLPTYRPFEQYRCGQKAKDPALEWPFEVAALASSQCLVSCALPLPCPTDGRLRIHQEQRHPARSRIATGHLQTRYAHGAYAAGGSLAHRRRLS